MSENRKILDRLRISKEATIDDEKIFGTKYKAALKDRNEMTYRFIESNKGAVLDQVEEICRKKGITDTISKVKGLNKVKVIAITAVVAIGGATAAVVSHAKSAEQIRLAKQLHKGDCLEVLIPFDSNSDKRAVSHGQYVDSLYYEIDDDMKDTYFVRKDAVDLYEAYQVVNFDEGHIDLMSKPSVETGEKLKELKNGTIIYVYNSDEILNYSDTYDWRKIVAIDEESGEAITGYSAVGRDGSAKTSGYVISRLAQDGEKSVRNAYVVCKEDSEKLSKEEISEEEKEYRKTYLTSNDSADDQDLEIE